MEQMKEVVSRYTTAKGYVEAAKYVFTSPHRATEAHAVLTVLPLNMLVAFSLELYFKAWLLDAGRASSAVRAFGHKVAKLHKEALQEGLPIIAQLDEVVAALAAGHEDFTYRYIEDGDEVTLVNWERAFGVLDELNQIVDEKIGASAAYGLEPSH